MVWKVVFCKICTFETGKEEEVPEKNKKYALAYLRLIKLLIKILFLYIVFLICRLISWFVGKIGKSSLRNIDGQLQTPVVYYEHRETGRKVVFAAMVHIGEKEYYQSVQESLDALPGHKVLYEGVSKMTAEEEQGLSEPEKTWYENMQYIFATADSIRQIMDWQAQKAGLAYPADWINTDMRLRELIGRLVQEKDVFPSGIDKMLEYLKEEKMQPILRWLFNFLFKRFLAVGMFLKVVVRRPGRQVFNQVVLDERNQIAIREMARYLEEGDIVAIWGAAHLKGIGKWLRRSGYIEVGREWHTVCHDRQISFLQSVKESKVAEKVAVASTGLKE